MAVAKTTTTKKKTSSAKATTKVTNLKEIESVKKKIAELFDTLQTKD